MAVLKLVEDKPGDLWVLVEHWKMSLEATAKSEKTIRSYVDTVGTLGEFLRANHMPMDVADIRREHLDAYQADQAKRFSKNTAALRHRTLKVFFGWLADPDAGGELEHNPMVGMRPPKVDLVEVPVVSAETIKQLLKVCDKSTFEGRRDEAIIRTFYDTGLRLAELTNLVVENVNTRERVLAVMGKGRKARHVRYGLKTGQALNRYERARAKHPFAESERWWLGAKGPMTTSGITQIIRRRCAQAEVEQLHPHVFRHSWAAASKEAGAGDGDLMVLGGWSSREMLDRYGRYTAATRALAAHDAFSPGDRL